MQNYLNIINKSKNRREERFIQLFIMVTTVYIRKVHDVSLKKLCNDKKNCQVLSWFA